MQFTNTCAYNYASNWQLSFFKREWKGKNYRKNYLMINILRSNVAALGFKLRLAVNHAVNCAMEVGSVLKLQFFFLQISQRNK